MLVSRFEQVSPHVHYIRWLLVVTLEVQSQFYVFRAVLLDEVCLEREWFLLYPYHQVVLGVYYFHHLQNRVPLVLHVYSEHLEL